MKQINFLIALFLAILMIGVGTTVQAQKDGSTKEIKQLVNDFYDAQATWNAEKLDNLLSEDFNESRTDGTGTTIFDKTKILSDQRGEGLPQFFKKIFMTVKSENEITGFAVQQSNDRAKFEYKLTERRRLKIETENSPKEFAKTERFKVSGSAAYRNGKWFLIAMQRTLIIPSPEELDDAFNFDMAMIMLLVEAQKKESKQKPN